MASIRKEIVIEASLDEAWAALSDWGALHERLAPGFATASHLDGGDRIVTFFNGSVVRERLVALDDQTRRIVWSITDGPYMHHNGAAQVLAAGDDHIRFIWVTDLLPDELAPGTEQLMERGLGVIKATLEMTARPRSSRSHAA